MFLSMHSNAYLHDRNNESNYLTRRLLCIDFFTGVVLDSGIMASKSQHFSVWLIWLQTLTVSQACIMSQKWTKLLLLIYTFGNILKCSKVFFPFFHSAQTSQCLFIFHFSESIDDTGEKGKCCCLTESNTLLSQISAYLQNIISLCLAIWS